MYNNKFVAVVKVGGKILREDNGTVFIPFGSEYEISFKNLHSTRAVVTVSIDGEDVLDGHRMVVDSNSDSKIEGFMRDDVVSHKFKFIEKTEQISNYRGDKISDGLIRIGFQFERALTIWDSGWVSFKDNGMIRSFPPVYGGLDTCDGYHPYSNRVCYSNQPLASSNVGSVASSQVNDAGITVKGSESDQSFNLTTTRFLEPQEHSIVFQLKGETSTGKVVTPKLVKMKVKCDTCGRVSFSGNKFCGNCGTSLVI